MAPTIPEPTLDPDRLLAHLPKQSKQSWGNASGDERSDPGFHVKMSAVGHSCGPSTGLAETSGSLGLRGQWGPVCELQITERSHLKGGGQRS